LWKPGTPCTCKHERDGHEREGREAFEEHTLDAG
jgi:hypothetical protein